MLRRPPSSSLCSTVKRLQKHDAVAERIAGLVRVKKVREASDKPADIVLRYRSGMDQQNPMVLTTRLSPCLGYDDEMTDIVRGQHTPLACRDFELLSIAEPRRPSPFGFLHTRNVMT